VKELTEHQFLDKWSSAKGVKGFPELELIPHTVSPVKSPLRHYSINK